MVGHGGIVAFEELHRHARRGQAPAALRRRRELRQVLPVPDRPAARARDVRRTTTRSTRPSSKQLLEALELGSLCAHGGGMPAPIRSLLAHFPEELGLDVIELTIDGEERHGPARDDDPRRRPRDGARSRRSASTSARPRSARAACAWSASRARPARSPPARPGRARGHEGRHAATRPPAASPPRSSSSCSPSSPARRPSTPSWRRSRGCSTSASRAGPARSHDGRARRAPPVPRLPARAVHLLRALRARVRRGPGHVRADRRSAAASAPTSPPASTRASSDSACVSCGACADTCPTDAITEISLLHLR